MDIKISAFKKVTDVNNPYNRDVFKCLQRIKDGNSASSILALRQTGDKSIKENLPCYTFSGVFSTRSKVGLKKHSGLIALDFDKLGTKDEVHWYKDSVCDDPYVFSAFISPSGDGLKILIKIPPVESDHELYFEALKKYFNNDSLDDSGKDVSRLCFESYDPDIYINPDSELCTI